MKTGAVLSNERQWDKFQELFSEALDDHLIFCDSEKFYPTLKTRVPKAVLLNDFLIQSEWGPMNAWAAGAASQWIRAWDENRYFEINLGGALYLYFAYGLVQVAKNMRFAQQVVLACRGGKLLVFEGLQERNFPEFSGNVCLQYYLRALSQDTGIQLEFIDLERSENQTAVVPNLYSPLRSQITSSLRSVMKKIWSWLSPAHRVDILAYGGLRHIRSLVVELKNRGLDVGIYDFDFHWEQFIYCLANGVPYWIPESIKPVRSIDPAPLAQRIGAAIQKALKASSAQGLFVYGGQDLSGFLQAHVLKGMKEYALQLAKEHSHYSGLLEQCDMGATVVDEDFGLQRSYYASFMNARNKRVFCLSHSNLAVDFEVSPEAHYFCKSITFVQSEFEKSMYVARGWAAESIQVTGTPRYDEMLKRRRAKASRTITSEAPYRLFFVCGLLWPFTPDIPGYVGCHNYCYGDIQSRCLDIVMEAVRDLPVEVVLKPHFFEDAPLWKAAVEKYRLSHRIRFEKSSVSFVPLLLSCDAIVLPHWSNAMIEAALCGKQTFFVEPVPSGSPSVERWQKAGYCRLAYDARTLKEAIQRDMNQRRSEATLTPDPYFLGATDGQATARVAETITHELASKPFRTAQPLVTQNHGRDH